MKILPAILKLMLFPDYPKHGAINGGSPFLSPGTFLVFIIVVFSWTAAPAQENDWRNVRNGLSIYTNGYCDQPYVVVTDDGSWLCVFTTNTDAEGSGGQHIVSCTSDDHGRTWSQPVRIEEPGSESASWAMPYLTDFGRVYVFYMYNGDKVHELNGRQNIREDMLGWYCYKYTDDGGRTWSRRFRLDISKTAVDLGNDWHGKVQIMWGIGKPVDVGGGMMFAFTKIGKYMLDDSEGWFVYSKNINRQRDPAKLKWALRPEGRHGLKNEKLGPINAEQNIFQMSNGDIYCMHRTVSGHPAEAYSDNKAKSWTVPQIPEYDNGVKIKHPRACPRIWKCKNGKYLFWHHNNGGRDFRHRNPAWVSGGIEKDGKIIWGQPEILFYDEDPNVRMSYPDLIEQDGRYWITETDKEHARVHEVPAAFLEMLWSQSGRRTMTREGLTAEWTTKELSPGSLTTPEAKKSSFSHGFTIDLRLQLTDLAAGQKILTAHDSKGRIVELRSAPYGSIEVVMSDGRQRDSWASDPGLISAYGTHSIAVIVDNGPKIIQFVIDGNVCTGGDYRQSGWGRYKVEMSGFQFEEIEAGKLSQGQLRPRGKLVALRIYNRPLMNTEAIGNHRFFMANEK